MATMHWRTSLAPWLHALPTIGKLYRPLDDEGDSCVDKIGAVLWFHWTAAREPGELLRQAELLQLLALLIQVDRTAFEQLLGSMEDAYSQYFVQHRARYEAPYSLGVYIKVSDDDNDDCDNDHTLWGALGMELPNDHESSDFTRAKREIRAHFSDGSRVALYADIPIPLFINVQSSSSELVEASLSRAEELLTSSQRHTDAQTTATITTATVPTRVFQVTTVQVTDPHGDNATTLAVLVLLARLADLGVCIPSITIESSIDDKSITDLTAASADTIVAYVKALQSLLGVRGVVEQPSGLRLQQLQLRPPFPAHVAIALCTAIAQSETLRRISVDTSPHATQHFPMEPFWRWLSCALFSSGSSASNVTMLEINADMLTDFYQRGMEEVAIHEDAMLSELDARRPIPSPFTDVVVDIPPNTEVVLVLDYGGMEKTVVAQLTSATQLQSLRVVHEDTHHDWLYCVLPGWGECRVDRLSVSVHQRRVTASRMPAIDLPLRDPPERICPRGVRHVRLHYVSRRTYTAVVNLLAMNNAHLRRLDIHEPDTPHEDDGDVCGDLLADALTYCTNLEEIDVFGAELTSVAVLVNAYDRQPRGAHVHTIKLRQLTVHDMGSVHAFFDALADPHHAMAQQLRGLTFHIIERTIQDHTRGSIFKSCLAMLRTNVTLQECRAITLSRRRGDKFHAVFHQFDGQPLAVRKAPLAIRSQLAFLSVVAAAGDTRSPSTLARSSQTAAVHRLDTNVVQNILTFAAQHETRQCSVEVVVSYEHVRGRG